MVIPLFNGEAYIQRAIESALTQTHPPLEVIVLDDGSSDGSAAIAKSLPVTYLYQTNAGLASARNAALERAEGDYIALLDQDDVWLPRKLERQLTALEADPSAGFALCYQHYVVVGGAEIPGWFQRKGSAEGEAAYSPSAWLLRRSTWERVGPFSPAQATEDIDWLARAMELDVRAVMVPEVLLLKRIHGSNMSGNVAAIKQGFIDALRGHIARTREARPG